MFLLKNISWNVLTGGRVCRAVDSLLTARCSPRPTSPRWMTAGRSSSTPTQLTVTPLPKSVPFPVFIFFSAFTVPLLHFHFFSDYNPNNPSTLLPFLSFTFPFYSFCAFFPLCQSQPFPPVCIFFPISYFLSLAGSLGFMPAESSARVYCCPKILIVPLWVSNLICINSAHWKDLPRPTSQWPPVRGHTHKNPASTKSLANVQYVQFGINLKCAGFDAWVAFVVWCGIGQKLGCFMETETVFWCRLKSSIPTHPLAHRSHGTTTKSSQIQGATLLKGLAEQQKHPQMLKTRDD